MRSITKQKELKEILKNTSGFQSLYIIGCGTCATMCKTGGIIEVLEMKEILIKNSKKITGWTVIPTACDVLSHEIIQNEKEKIDRADAILEMSCGFGNQQIAHGTDKPVIPANDTISMSIEFPEARFSSACLQCGECLLGMTGSICPVVICPKSLCNGPCGGTDHGKCEVDKNKDCAWTLIYNSLKAQGRLKVFKEYQPPKDYSRGLKPVIYNLEWEK